MSKTKIAITVTGALIAIAAVGIGIWFGVVRAHSSKYNLITLKNRELPAPQKPTEDAFVQLSDVNMHFVKYGEGEKTVILLHGNGGSANIPYIASKADVTVKAATRVL